MAVTSALVDDQIIDRLTAAVVREVLGSIWPVACQSCGLPLGQDRPALAVDDLGLFAQATLYHPGCRPSEWSARPLRATTAATLTWTSQVFASLGLPGTDPSMVMMLLNPALESATLMPSPNGWSVQVSSNFTEAGLRRPRPDLAAANPVPGAIARLKPLPTGDTRLTVTVTAIEEFTYTVAIPDETCSKIKELGGFMLAVTHALNPDDIIVLNDLDPVLNGDRTVAGWVELTATPRPTPTPVLVLHHSARQVILGEILDLAPHSELSAIEAQQWAARAIDRPAPLIRWRSLPDHVHATQRSQTPGEVALLPSPAGWLLVTVLSRAPAVVAATPMQALSWASLILGFAPTWRPGASPAGITTLYATDD
jgi:hypothetical protein